jgi:hypothetical protein
MVNFAAVDDAAFACPGMTETVIYRRTGETDLSLSAVRGNVTATLAAVAGGYVSTADTQFDLRCSALTFGEPKNADVVIDASARVYRYESHELDSVGSSWRVYFKRVS